MKEACDIVVPVHDGLHLVLDLLESLQGSTDVPHRILLVDDGSDAYVARALTEQASGRPDLEVLHLPENVGFVRAANAGLARSTAPYACVLNSDTIVTPGWLDKLVRCVESDPRILVANPLSNAAANLSVVLPPGFTPWMMADRLSALAPHRCPDVVTAVGFCLFLRRAALERYGDFDEAYGRGYCEESDLCMRALADGWRVVAAEDAFVFHHGESTFADRDQRYAANRALFDARWGDDYERRLAAYRADDPLQAIRDALFSGLVLAGHLRRARDERSLAHKAWRLVGHLRSGRRGLVAERLRDEAAAWRRRLRGRGGGVRPSASHRDERFDPEDQPLAFATAAYARALPRSPARLKIAFLVHDAPLAGGVLEIAQIANRLVLEGCDAFFATTSGEEMQRRLRLLHQPLVFAGDGDLIANLPDVDVVVATHWRTAWHWLAAIAERRPHVAGVYFVQDFEPDFYPPILPEHRRALESYARVAHRVVTSAWLAGRLAEHGLEAERIPVGVNLGIFHPRASRLEEERPLTVTAITRPDPEEARRGFADLLAACAAVHRADASVRFAFFGCDPGAMPSGLPFPYEHRGVLTAPEQVARHLAACDVLVDPSRYQAFGRPGLEAMACGVATVLPREGGIAEYARDGENTIAFAGGDADAMAGAVLALRDRPLRERIARAGLATAQSFDHREEGRRHLALYRRLCGRSSPGGLA